MNVTWQRQQLLLQHTHPNSHQRKANGLIHVRQTLNDSAILCGTFVTVLDLLGALGAHLVF